MLPRVAAVCSCAPRTDWLVSGGWLLRGASGGHGAAAAAAAASGGLVRAAAPRGPRAEAVRWLSPPPRGVRPRALRTAGWRVAAR